MDKLGMNDKRFVLLNDKDNILVCCDYVGPKAVVVLNGEKVIIRTEINVGHKVARRAITAGEKIVRYGAPIGSAIVDIEIGQHVHLHNMKSDYISSHTRQSKVEISK